MIGYGRNVSDDWETKKFTNLCNGGRVYTRVMMRWSEGEKVERNVSGKKGYWRQV